MTRAKHSVALTEATNEALQAHVLQHYRLNRRNEDLCFALFRPSQGRSRFTAIIEELILPSSEDRQVHGNASFNPIYFARVLSLALEKGAGIAFIHSHPVPGWQDMSPDDVAAEELLAPRVFAATKLPLVGMTMGTDGVLSARHWVKNGREYCRQWCETVRVVGQKLKVHYHPALPKIQYKEEFSRTLSTFGPAGQEAVSRIRVGCIGAGSVGGFIAEAVARQATEDLLTMDFDTVKPHNLDRLLYATARNVKEKKIDALSSHLIESATASNFRVEALDLSFTDDAGYLAALDCDVLFCPVDRPWPRQVANLIAYAHLIPVIDGGIGVRMTSEGHLRGAEWRAHIASPGEPCLECRQQYSPADVALERSGLLDDPVYVKGLPKEHFVNRNQNIFTFAMSAASLMMLQYLHLLGIPAASIPIAQTYIFGTGMIGRSKLEKCYNNCLFPGLTALGDHCGLKVIN